MSRPSVQTAGLVAFVLGALVLFIGWWVSPTATFVAYLGGFAFALGLAVGSLFLLLIGHTSGARWFIVFRRHAEIFSVTIPILFIAFVPVLVAPEEVYLWADPGQDLPHHLAELIEHKRPWLNVPSFRARAVGYFLVWILVSEGLLALSLAQHKNPARSTKRLRILAAVALWPVALTVSFASFDWFMSLDVAWYSTMYPVYFFAGSTLSGLALTATAEAAAARPDHFHALGKLILTFVIFWTYIAFSQFFLVWMADLPAEVPFYIVRTSGGWGVLAVALIIGHFILPFAVLLSREVKRRKGGVVLIGAWLLLFHAVDMVWYVVPSGEEVPSWWLVLASLAFFSGLFLLGVRLRARGVSLTPLHDPLLEESLRYETR